MTYANVVDEEAKVIRVMKDKCSTCILRKDGLELTPGYLKKFLAGAEGEYGNIPCHKTYPPLGPVTTEQAICKGWWDSYGIKKIWFRLLFLNGWIKWMEESYYGKEKEQRGTDVG